MMKAVVPLLIAIFLAGIVTSANTRFPIAVLGTGGSEPYAVKTKLTEPRIFGEGVISTQDDEFGGTFSPDGKDFYFAKRTPGTIASSLIAICVSHCEHGKWGRPQIAPFSGRFIDFAPFVSPDGSRLFFSSIRPVDGKSRQDTDIWFVQKEGDGQWSEPRNLGALINTAGPEQTASVALDGTIYFSAVRPDGKGSLDIYRSRLADGKYGEPENLGDAINGEAPDTQPYIAPDQSYLIFASTGRPDSPIGAGSPYPRSDLYVSFNRAGKWTPARRLPFPINTEATESYPFVSPDGRYLFFTSERNFVSIPMRKKIDYRELQTMLHKAGNGLGDFYQVDLDAAGIEPGGASR